MATLFLVQGLRPAAASGEQFAITVSPTWLGEAASSGTHLVLFVSNAQLGPYTFNWTVTDPSGKLTSVSKNTLSTAASWNQTAAYPTDFTGTLNLVGIYNINVAEILPSINSSVERATFQVGLTDNRTYQRNEIVHVNGAGYVPLDRVNVTFTHTGLPVAGFPTFRNATATGNVSFSWATHPNTTLGGYTIQLKGASTPPKSPTDIQNFTVYPTNTTTTRLSISSGQVSRSEIQQFIFNATYLDGQQAATGLAQIILTEPDGTTNHIVTAHYDTVAKTLVSTFPTTLSSNVGLWTATLRADSYDDGYGNGGPSSPISTSFDLLPASLNVTSQPYLTAFGAGGTIVFSSKVLTPSGTNFNQGTVTATLTYAGLTVTGPIVLVYDATLGRWTGSYKVGVADPSGTWVLTLSASDVYGNTGQAEAFAIVNTSGGQNQAPFGLPTWVWLVAILAVLGTGFGMLIFRRRNVKHQKVKLDLEAIHRKANEVKGSDFLKSIQAQLNRRTERIAREKELAKK